MEATACLFGTMNCTSEEVRDSEFLRNTFRVIWNLLEKQVGSFLNALCAKSHPSSQVKNPQNELMQYQKQDK